ncbi:restriction endonuclease [Paractinoplanes hotanensis]|uniref:Restriction endonuclease n=1 Tax=Paractinoplanes hotanensis TaxID=2906497 RepID=A0ABT0YH28_9ACTN|nr:restriction endonuclease [Actinoplanes hotanensis]MCM4084797.1 restriction endonuclease [Actinoplanes hotanensis]
MAALMLLRQQGPGNRITPSRGDRGVDVRLVDLDGIGFFQVKRYPRPLTSIQKTQTEKSWTTFFAETAPNAPVKSWSLACPWNPSNEALEWLETLTAEAQFPTDWMGRATLEAMAAENPALVEFYFGDGGERLHRAITNAFQGGRDVPEGIPGEDLLEATTSRMIALSSALNDVDPFYRYEIDLRAGRLRDEPLEAALQTETNAAFVEYRQVTEDRFGVMRIFPRSPAALQLCPISTSIRLTVENGSPDQEAIEAFRDFGAPFADIPGTVTAVTGPPGIHRASGDGRFTVMAVPSNAANLPDLELRLLNANGQPIHTLDLVDVELARGLNTVGVWLSGKDRAGALAFTMLMNGPDGQDEIRVEPQPIGGKSPAEVLPAIRFKAAMTAGTQLVLAVRGGPALPGVWPLEGIDHGPGPHNVAVLVEALVDIQRHTFAGITIPDLDTADLDELADILRAARLLRGERVEVTWTEVAMTLGTPERRVLYACAKLADPTSAQNAQPGDEIRLVPAANKPRSSSPPPQPDTRATERPPSHGGALTVSARSGSGRPAPKDDGKGGRSLG